MLMDEGMDTGDILKTVETEIGAEETAEELIDELREKGTGDEQIAALLESALKEVKPKPDGDGEERKSAEDLFGMKFAE